ncbi:MAG: response regulator [Spirochaetia bacterium]|nr:response regulator [Spirochaetia bacterium]
MEQQSLRLLYVDDNDGLREVMAEEFRALGIEVFLAGGAIEAIQILKSETIDGVLTDMKMPDIDGVGLKKLAESELARVPKVWAVYSAYNDRAIKEYKNLGFGEVFFKPLKPKLITHFFKTKLEEAGAH